MAGRAVLAVAGVLATAGCGGGAPSPEEVAECLREGGATVELDPSVSQEVGAANFAPVLTPRTEVVARGDMTAGGPFLLFETDKLLADEAEDRAVAFGRLFGVGEDHVLRNGPIVLLINARAPERDRELARDCTETR